MKIHKPINDVEHILSDSDSIVSNTDLKGVITYVNDTFIRISGYSREELMGAPHNIIRHPDMPPEAFADLWRSMKAGRPWTGLVKNRCKNGDYYWVLANATPIYQNDQLVGYMSVRSKPERDQVNAADAAYRLFREGKADNLRIEDGKVVKASVLGRFKLFKDVNIKSHLLVIIGLLSVVLLIIGGVGLFTMSKDEEGLRTVYEDRTLTMDQTSSIQKLLTPDRLNAVHDSPELPSELFIKSTFDAQPNIAGTYPYKNEDMTAQLAHGEDAWADKINAGLKPASALLHSGELTATNRMFINRVNYRYQKVGENIQQLLLFQLNSARQELSAAQARHNLTRSIFIGLSSTGISLALWLGFALIRGTIRPLEAAIVHFNKIAQGNYRNVIEIERRNEVGKVMEALKSMQTRLGFDVAETRRVADESLRVKIALDNVSTGVMIADNNREIIYVNKAVRDLLSKAEKGIQQAIPGFAVDNLVGSKIDDFHKNYAYQAQLLGSLTGSYNAGVTLGGRSIVINVNPVINEQGQRLGSVVEWQDRTEELAVEREVSTIVVASSMGDFTKRFDLHGKTGFLRELGEGLNQLLYTSETGLSEVARVLGALSRGDLTETIVNDYQGTFGQLKDDANTTVEKLKDIINQIKEATDNINTGAKEIALGNNDLSCRTEQQAASLQETASSMEQLTATVQANTEHAKQANQLVIGATEIAGQGSVVVGQVVSTMNDIKDSSLKIEEIITVIDDIAFQTNILAFNAAVEAARAGTNGQGFAVVAAEVRNLAQRAAISSAEIKSLIEASVRKIDAGSKLAAQAGLTMEDVLSSIHGVTGMVSEIADASVDQSIGIGRINRAISQMDGVTQQNAALVEQAAAAAELLEEQAQSLVVTVGCFKIDETYDTFVKSRS